MPVCNQCGAFVTARFARVFGDNQDDVYGCYECAPASALVNGVASVERS